MDNIKTFEWDPSDYAEHSSAQYKWGKELLDLLNLNGNEALLDIGCGDGKITELISRKLINGKTVGIDSSKDMIRFAKQKYSNDKFSNLTFIQADACNPEFENEFDIVYSNAALHWIEDHVCVLKNAYRSLKNNGRILFQMGGKGNLNEMFDIISATLKNNKWSKYFDGFIFPYFFYSDSEYIKFLKKANFRADKIELIPRTMAHKNVNELAGWIRTTWHPFLNRVPHNLRVDFVNDIVNDFLKTFPLDSNGRTAVKMVRLQVQAHK